MAQEFIFVHGGRQASWVWAPVIIALERQGGPSAVRVLALDVPGCGAKRGRPTERLSIPDVVAELAGEIDRSGVSEAVIVGHSQAGTLLPALAQSCRAALRKAVYVACCAPAPGQSVAEMMGEGLHEERPDVVGWPLPPATTEPDELFRAMFCNDMDEAATAAFMGAFGPDDWPSACSVGYRDWRYPAHPAVSATFVAALRDASLPLPWQLRFAERLGADRIVRIDAGHQVMQTRPHALAEVLLAE
jgi:pimeloyl-ACP methyl ester carboxylesterase